MYHPLEAEICLPLIHVASSEARNDRFAVVFVLAFATEQFLSNIDL
jgi:hypothetical protein